MATPKSDPRDPRTPQPPQLPAEPLDPRQDPRSPSYDPRYTPADPTRHQHEAPDTRKDRTPRSARGGAGTSGSAGERPEFPKPLVRLKQGAGGWDSEVRMVADGDAEQAAKDAGFQTIEVPEHDEAFVEFPKWVYHPDGHSQIVHSQDEAATLDGYVDVPPGPPEGSAPTSVPPGVTAAAATSAANQPPFPVDRG